jgi:hypothetical protein
MTADKRARSKSGQQIGRDNTDRLKAYLDSLQLAGLSVPQTEWAPEFVGHCRSMWIRPTSTLS